MTTLGSSCSIRTIAPEKLPASMISERKPSPPFTGGQLDRDCKRLFNSESGGKTLAAGEVTPSSLRACSAKLEKLL